MLMFEDLSIYLFAFLFSGIVCVIGQLIFELTTYTPGHITSSFVVLGALLDTFGWYDRFIQYCGGGALIPITSFGHSLIHGALHAAEKKGILGILLGMFDLTAAGITSAIIFSFVIALIFRPKG